MNYRHILEPVVPSNPVPSDSMNPEEAFLRMRFGQLLQRYHEMVNCGELTFPNPAEVISHELNIRNSVGGRPVLVFKVLVARPTDGKPFEDLWWK